jgi:hypothetical protein
MNPHLLHNRRMTERETFPDSCTPRRACCLRCGGTLQEGFLVEHSQGFDPAAATTWHAGRGERSSWTGVQIEPTKQRAVVARRCSDCGGLELFAP